MPEKVNKKKEIKTNSDVFEIYLGTFNDDVFTWYSIKKFKDPTQAYKEFKKYVNTQLKYTDEELKKVWDTGRLDIELRQGNKLLNWVGIYSREVKELSKAEEKEVEKGEVKKSKKDSLTPTEIFLKEYCSDIIRDSEDVFYADCDNIQFFINTKKGERVPTNEYSFNEFVQEMGLDIDDVTEIYNADDLSTAYKRLKAIGDYFVERYLPSNNFMFKDIDLGFGDTIAIKFIKPKVIDSDHKIIYEDKGVRFNYKKPYRKDEDLYLKSNRELPQQTLARLKEDSSDERYLLTFNIENDLKGSAGEIEYIELWCGLDARSLVVDYIPSQDEVHKFLEDTLECCEEEFNETNTYENFGHEPYDGEIGTYFTDIVLYKLDDSGTVDDYSKDKVKSYDDIELYFRATPKH